MQKSLRSALVTTKWLQDIVKSKSGGHRILDAAWHMPNTGRNARQEYLTQHIPGALYFDVDECADKSTDLPHMIPSPETFENYVNNLGISNDTHIIVYDNNPQCPLFSAQRVWWTFRLFGHDNISLLEGGLQKWISESGPVTNEIVDVPKGKFVSQFRPHLVKDISDIEKNVKNSEFQLVDARSDGRFNGTAPEPRSDIKSGSIIGSSNIPFTVTLDIENKTMKSPEHLKKIFADQGVDLEKQIVATCGSGMTACMLALAAFQCGNENVAVYDGSWTEFSQKGQDTSKQNVPSS